MPKIKPGKVPTKMPVTTESKPSKSNSKVNKVPTRKTKVQKSPEVVKESEVQTQDVSTSDLVLTKERRAKVKERIAEQAVVQPNGCWHWRATSFSGPPVLMFNRKRFLIRRLVYSIMVNPKVNLQGRSVFCTCNDYRCINPKHLTLGPSNHGSAKRALAIV